jgi:hypothetical protein
MSTNQSLQSCSEVEVIDDENGATIPDGRVVSQASLPSTASNKEISITQTIKKKAAEGAIQAGLGYLLDTFYKWKDRAVASKQRNSDDDDAGDAGDAGVAEDTEQELMDELLNDCSTEISRVASPLLSAPPAPV